MPPRASATYERDQGELVRLELSGGGTSGLRGTGGSPVTGKLRQKVSRTTASLP